MPLPRGLMVSIPSRGHRIGSRKSNNPFLGQYTWIRIQYVVSPENQFERMAYNNLHITGLHNPLYTLQNQHGTCNSPICKREHIFQTSIFGFHMLTFQVSRLCRFPTTRGDGQLSLELFDPGMGETVELPFKNTTNKLSIKNVYVYFDICFL